MGDSDNRPPPRTREEVPLSEGRVPQVHDLWAALTLVTALPLSHPDPRSEAAGRATLFFPLVGLLLGVVLSGVHGLLASRVPQWILAVIVVALWEFGGWRSEREPVIGSASALIKIVCLALAPVRPAGLLFAPMLARWCIVVLATGARDATAPGRKFNAAISFQEFALTSIFTFATVFAIAEAFGILIVVSVAAAALILRLASHRWYGGVSWRFLTASARATEAQVIVLCALL